MHHFIYLFLVGVLNLGLRSGLCASPPGLSIVARVNGEAILEQDLQEDTKAKTYDEKIKRAIQFRLILQEARRRGIDKLPELQNEFNTLLYKHFMEDERKTRHADFNPSEEELRAYYEQRPLLRIRHLVLSARTETEKQVAQLSLDQIKKELKKGTPFAKLCTQYSQDSTGPFGGDTDFRGPHNFPEDFYEKILRQKKEDVSEPIELGNMYHLFQWFDKKPYTGASAPYLQYLQAQLSEEKERGILIDLLRALEINAKVEFPTVAGTDPRGLSHPVPTGNLHSSPGKNR